MRTTGIWDDGVKPGVIREVYGPYIDAPTWPWTLAGWLLAALYVLLALEAWLRS